VHEAISTVHALSIQFLHKSFFWTEFILISLISSSVTSTKRLAAILQISILPVGDYNSLIRQMWSNLTNQLVGFVIFSCAKILITYIASPVPSSILKINGFEITQC
jgi:hypothetical protein